jgi:hypothetical protein
LLDDNAFGIASAASYLRIDIILPIASSWKASFAILEFASSDVAREWDAASLFESGEQIIGFLGSWDDRRRLVRSVRRTDRTIAGKLTNACVGIDGRSRRD